ncbi:D-alanyl-D-alanine carboxypeptidase [uncultured Caudovirales phage]|uniref:D-alanyl-D-alanine carboxypeptidase n=1 Tax=uncultured Caudovirales phage TaxID=2100421 RepID=A0A6J5M6W3_9CAUD|nr:D-alanyl-D-alanine carboxypeptidase [uncultured Caudovirales phage]
MLAFLRSLITRGPVEAPKAPAPEPPGAIPVLTFGEAPATAPLSLTARDLERLKGVHPDLVRVVIRACERVPFFVAEGRRTPERQKQLVAEGKSKTLNSRHLTGHAVDLYPISDVPIPKMQMADFKPLVDAMRAASAVEKVALVCGYDWGWDAPHFELARSSYPA